MQEVSTTFAENKCVKHLFLVHSPITYLVSVSIINQFQIEPNDAIIIFYQFKKIDGRDKKYTSVDIDEFYEQHNFFIKAKNYLQHFNIGKRVDKLITDITEHQQYIAYVPSMYFVAKLICTNPLCQSFNFIEEGLLNYYKEETLTVITAINAKEGWRTSLLTNTKQVLFEMYMVLRGYNFRLQGLPFSYSCYNGLKNARYYGLTGDAFPLVYSEENKITVPFNKQTFEWIKQDEKLDISDKCVWIGDAGVQLLGYSENVYLHGIQKGCIDFLEAKNIDSVLIKFHREEPDPLREKIKKLFEKSDIAINIIPDSVVMELLLFNAKNVTLIGIYSSLLYYASLMGHASYSIYLFVHEEYSKALVGRDFDFYWNKVKPIEPASQTIPLPS